MESLPGRTCFRTSRTRRSASLHSFCVSLPHRLIAIASISPAAWLPTRQTFTGTNSVGNGRRTVRYSRPEFLSLNSKNMQVDLPETTSKIDGPLVKQFSIFLPNKVGAMLDVVKLLHAHNTHIVAMSISESTDSAIARIVVSDPERVEELFREHNVAFGVCAMLIVELREVARQLATLLAAQLRAE